MKKSFVLVISAILIFLRLYPTTVYVYNESNNEKIDFVIVSQKTSVKQVMTPFETDLGIAITISCIGFRDTTLTTEGNSMDVFLQVNPLSIEEAVIFSDRLVGTVRERESDDGLISAFESISPLITVRHYNRSTVFSLSGMSQEHILFSLDKVPLINQMSRIIDLDLISPAMVQSIALSKTLDSSMKGENLFGGVVDITTNKLSRLKAIASTSFNSSDIAIDVNLKDLSGGFFLTSFENMVLPQGKILDNSYKSSFGFNLKGRTDMFNITLLRGFSEQGDPGVSGFRYQRSSIKNSLFVLTSSVLLRKNLELTTSAMKSSYIYFNDEISPASDDTSRFESLLSSLTIFKEKWRTVISHQFNSADGTKIRKSSEKFPSISLSIENGGFTADFLTGISFSENFQLVYSASLASMQSLFGQQIMSGVKTSVRRPTFNELYWQGDAFARGNEDLESEKLTGIFFSLEKNLTNFKSRSDAGLNWYSSLIKWVSENGIYTPQNISSVINPYITFYSIYENRIVIIENTASVSYNLMDGLKLVPYTPAFTDNLSAKVMLGRFFASLSGDWRSSSFISAANTKKLQGSFFMREAEAGLEIRGCKISLSILNPFDSAYESANGYYLEGRNIKLNLKAVI
ncbi:MAG: hypothetical protein PHW02_03965 [bacterium]|nr:hypothetical protein [bacterium]